MLYIIKNDCTINLLTNFQITDSTEFCYIHKNIITQNITYNKETLIYNVHVYRFFHSNTTSCYIPTNIITRNNTYNKETLKYIFSP